LASFKSYLNNNAPFLNARNKWQAAGGKRADAQAKWEATKETDPNYQKILAAFKTAQQEEATARTAKDLAETNAKAAYDKINASKKEAETKKKDTATQSQITLAQAEVDKYTNAGLAVPADKQNKLDKLKGELSSNFQQSPTGGIVSGQPNVNQSEEIKPQNFDELAKTAREFVKNRLDDTGRLQLANELKAAGIPNVPITGEYTDALANAYKNAINSAKSAWNAFKEYPTVEAFLTEQARQVNVLKAAGGGTELPDPFGTQNIYNKSTAEGVIDNLFQTILKRDASSSEINSLFKQLQAEQKKLSSMSKGTYKMINGRQVLVKEEGLDPRVFLENKIKELPAYKESQAAKAEQNKLSLAATALANGYDLERDFGSQLPNWLNAINKGENISKFQTTIRNSARLALPEAVRNSIDPNEDLTTSFATYISNYAKTFGVPANQVSLSKIIPMATNEKGFVPIYDFEKKKRQLAEWDTTPDARTETANVVSTVLRDFGFKGQ
jgi:hypothetical protein